MARTAIVAPSWDLFREAAEHINCALLGDAEYRKQAAALPAIWRIGAVCYVTTGAHYEGQAGLPARLWGHAVEPPAAHEQAVSTIDGYELLVSGDYVASNIPLSPTHIVTHGLVPISPEARQEVEAWMDTWPTPTEGRARRAAQELPQF